MIKVGIDSSPLKTVHAARGIGVYTRNLIEALEKIKIQNPKIEIEEYNPHKNDYAIIHYPYFDLFYCTLPLIKKIKTIVTVHDVIPLVFPEHYPPGIKGFIRYQIQKFSLKGVQAVITDSYSSKEDIFKYLNYPKEKISVIYLAPSKIYKQLKLTSSIIQTIRLKYHLPENFVLYVGDINYNKNIPSLVKACERLKISLVIVGKQALEKNIDRNHPENKDLVWVQDHYSNKVILTGFVPEKELAIIYNLATVYCQPSFYEGFGLPLLEAMACGCPVVAANTSSLPEICEEAAFMVDPYDYNNIAEGITRVIEDRKTRDMLINRGLNQVKKFSWEKTALMTMEIYQSVLQEKK
jgi:glycosyltransferase involved in cell wall biosynthesis